MPLPRAMLVPTDLSTAARHAAQRAAMLARDNGASMELLHVIETGALTQLTRLLADPRSPVVARIVALADTDLAALAHDIEVGYGVVPKTHCVQGPLLASITGRAGDIGADLLVLGASHAGYLRQWLLGATAERLLRKTTLPMLFVRQPPHQDYRTVLVTVDFSDSAAQSIKMARQICPKARLILLHACEFPFEGKMRFAGVDDNAVWQYRQSIRRDALQQLQTLASRTGIDADNWQPIVTLGDPVHDIVQQQLDHDADLVVVGKHGAGMTEDLLLGSVTQQVLGQVLSDVLVAAR